MTDEELGEQLDAADRALRASIAGTLDVEAGLRAAKRGTGGGAAHQTERARMTAPGRRSDDGRRCDLLVVQEADCSWSFHAPPLGSPGVRVTGDIAAGLAQWILARAR